ncbi:PLAC8 family-domain-containing protein [Aspergillus pseudodeflectus]|uniref:PLAC8 family-domain-containing protein n=1 Tax=Aspergillus pseudodeflectus TaxID=176178 RepID=A0ABR4K2X2_9EURO
MNPRLRLDTSGIGVNQRYSFVQTPVELSPPSQPGSRLPSPPTARSTWSTHRPPPVDIEKAQHLPQNPSNVYAPDLQQHPANYAPFAEPVPQQPATRLPNSPGPLPAKIDYSTHGSAQDHENSQHKLSIVPDANPLQSPKIPYFPPPATTPVPQVPTGNDLATYHRPGQISHPNQEIRGGGWTHGLCDCSSSIGTCCLGLVCPCILYGKTQHRLSMRSKKEDPTNMLGYEACNGSCTAMALLCGCQWLLATIQHTRIRRAYAIQGSIASDCVRATCCTCCTLIQDEKEIRKREEERAKAARASGAALVSPYLAPVPMSYGPLQR